MGRNSDKNEHNEKYILMYTDKKNILQLAVLLREHGIKKMVLCPGSRNIALVQTFTNIPEFECYPVTDERSAGFFAMGLALQAHEPVVVCCTSGSALLNLHPAVSEAFYQQIPLIVISADRPEAWIGQMDGQTLPQNGVFGSLVKKSINLPEVKTEEDKWYCNRLINEALLETHHHGLGPVHINIPVSDPFFDLPTEVLPQARKIDRLEHPSGSCIRMLAQELISCRSCITIAGQSNEEYEYSDETARILGEKIVWLGENLSNKTCPIEPIGRLEPILASIDESEAEEFKPKLLITFAGHIISKRLKKFLRQYKPLQHWHVCKDGAIADLYCSLTKVIEMSPEKFWNQIALAIKSIQEEAQIEGNTASDKQTNDERFVEKWKKKAESIPSPCFPYSEMQAIGLVQKNLPNGSILHLANSSSVRYSQLFPLPKDITILSNRGVNGIEGSLSTAIGYSSACPDKLNFIFIGDLSFFYDMNALWNNNYGNNIRILLVNNSGGEIFKTFQGLQMNEKSSHIVIADHKSTAKAWTEDRGFTYLQAHDDEELQASVKIFTSHEIIDKPMILEVFTDKDTDVLALNEWFRTL